MSEHRWGNPDAAGVRACNNEGCTVRVADAFRRWQPRKGAHWRSQLLTLISPCHGELVTKGGR